MKEEWKPIKEFNGEYEVSNDGRVRKRSGEILRVYKGKIHGYMSASFYINGVSCTRLVHRLVADAFIEHKEERNQVHHIDEDRTNNNVKNLMWVTPKEHGKLRSNKSKERFRNTYRTNKEKRKKSILARKGTQVYDIMISGK